MRLRARSLLILVACMALLGMMAFAAACGGSEETTTTVAAATQGTGGTMEAKPHSPSLTPTR
jgi:hypothetical protein